MDELRAKIAQLVLDAHRRMESPHGFEDEFQAADRILAILEIAEALVFWNTSAEAFAYRTGEVPRD